MRSALEIRTDNAVAIETYVNLIILTARYRDYNYFDASYVYFKKTPVDLLVRTRFAPVISSLSTKIWREYLNQPVF